MFWTKSKIVMYVYGVPQDSILNPLLFLFNFINDLPENTPSSLPALIAGHTRVVINADIIFKIPASANKLLKLDKSVWPNPNIN